MISENVRGAKKREKLWYMYDQNAREGERV